MYIFVVVAVIKMEVNKQGLCPYTLRKEISTR